MEVNDEKNNLIIIWMLFILAVVGAIFLFKSHGPDPNKMNITVYTTPDCGCCRVYSNYLKKEFNVDLVTMGSLTTIKDEFGVPLSMQSCHTSQIGPYFVEGHIPIEGIKRLLVEKPDIKGIAMPGMPSGSPGMPGAKYGQFVIYGVEKDGGISEYMRI